MIFGSSSITTIKTYLGLDVGKMPANVLTFALE